MILLLFPFQQSVFRLSNWLNTHHCIIQFAIYHSRNLKTYDFSICVIILKFGDQTHCWSHSSVSSDCFFKVESITIIVFLDLVFSATKGNTAPFYQTDNNAPYVPNDPQQNFVLFPLTFPSPQRIQVQTVLGPMISALLYLTKAGNNFLKFIFFIFA